MRVDQLSCHTDLIPLGEANGNFVKANHNLVLAVFTVTKTGLKTVWIQFERITLYTELNTIFKLSRTFA